MVAFPSGESIDSDALGAFPGHTTLYSTICVCRFLNYSAILFPTLFLILGATSDPCSFPKIAELGLGRQSRGTWFSWHTNLVQIFQWARVLIVQPRSGLLLALSFRFKFLSLMKPYDLAVAFKGLHALLAVSNERRPSRWNLFFFSESLLGSKTVVLGLIVRLVATVILWPKTADYKFWQCQKLKD